MQGEHNPDVDVGSPSAADVIDLKAARRRDALRRRIEEGHVPETRDDVRRRMVQNLAAGAVVVALVVGGAWLIIHLRESLRIEACLETGRRNCIKIDPGAQP